jgi:hypothetical protein
VASCDFCNGSALATYNFVPSPIRPHVIELRIRRAVAQAQTLLKASSAALKAAPTLQQSRSLVGLLFQMDRTMGLLENAVVAVRELAGSGRQVRAFAARVIRRCRGAALRIDARMRAVLKRLAQITRVAADRPGAATVNRRLLQQRADLYLDLSRRRGFQDSTLRHPFLKIGGSARG